MVRIDESLLRKKSEHNDLCLSTLEEVFYLNLWYIKIIIIFINFY